MSDVYYNPENFGLERVAEIDYSDGCYCFDCRVIWRHIESGKLYTARDAGCSCPSPFEDYRTLESLQPFNLDEVMNEAKAEASGEYGYHGDNVPEFLALIQRLEMPK